jgi:threonine/homoserine/homoserine lactone efflux protein
MTAAALVGFASLCLLLAITPGPDTFLVLRYGLGGMRFGMLAATGSAAGSLLWAAVVALGLANVLNASPPVFLALKIAGGLYLVYLGIAGLRRRADVTDSREDHGVRRRPGPALRSGLLSCALNPKVGLFFLAVVPQFLPADTANFGTIMTLGVIDAVIAFGWLALVAAGADRATQWLRRPRVTRTMARFSSTTLAVLGLATLIAVV